VTSDGSPYSRFRRAIEREQLLPALDASRDLRHLSLGDALDLCRLLAIADDPLFPRAASRWLARFAGEARATLSQVQLAAAALGELWEDPSSALPGETLRALLARTQRSPAEE
jgi:hypothetical protein